jgi:hypothetical protein
MCAASNRQQLCSFSPLGANHLNNFVFTQATLSLLPPGTIMDRPILPTFLLAVNEPLSNPFQKKKKRKRTLSKQGRK